MPPPPPPALTRARRAGARANSKARSPCLPGTLYSRLPLFPSQKRVNGSSIGVGIAPAVDDVTAQAEAEAARKIQRAARQRAARAARAQRRAERRESRR